MAGGAVSAGEPGAGGRPTLLPTEVSHAGQTLLITLAGPDRPGVTRRLFTRLADHPLLVVDVEQVVIRGQLVLGVLVAQPEGVPTALHDVAAAATALGIELGFAVTASPGAGERPVPERGRLHVTLLGAPLRPEAMAALAGCVADHGGNIDRIERLAAYPVTAIELLVSGADPSLLRPALAAEAARVGFDVAVQRAGLHRRGKRLVVMDVDSTLIQGEVIEMIAEHAGCVDEVSAVTAAAMRGEIDFAESLRRRVALLEGVPVSALDDVRDHVQLAPGARTLVRTLKRLGYQCGIVSGGFTHVTDALAADLGLDFSTANVLEVADGRLTGRLTGVVVDRAEKARALVRFATQAGVPLTHTVAIGDGANDLDMLEVAGLGVAFNAKPVVREAADAALNVPYLDAILYLLGVTREEIDAADSADAVPIGSAVRDAVPDNPPDAGPSHRCPSHCCRGPPRPPGWLSWLLPCGACTLWSAPGPTTWGSLVRAQQRVGGGRVTEEMWAVPNPRRDCSKALVGYTPDGLGYLAWCPAHYVTPDGDLLPWYSPAAETLVEARLLRAAHSLTQETGGQAPRATR